jgi:putative hydrolase of HD superfamily
MDRLEKQLQFIVEIDKVKSVLRRTKIFHGNRHENDAEHSWHIALMALVLNEYSNEKIDILKVLKMVLIHDLVEIHTGDLSVYSTNPQEKQKSELEAAQKIFNVLPNDQNQEFLSLWKEFDKRETPEAKFASALDRLEPIMQNYKQDGYAWKKHKISYEQIINLNKLWEYAKGIIDECKMKKII